MSCDVCENCPGPVGFMTVDKCRSHSEKCSGAVYAKIERAVEKVDKNVESQHRTEVLVARIAERFGISVEGNIGPVPHRRSDDPDPTPPHVHERESSTVSLPRWAAIGIAAAFAFAGIAAILMYQTKVDVEKIVAMSKAFRP